MKTSIEIDTTQQIHLEREISDAIAYGATALRIVGDDSGMSYMYTLTLKNADIIEFYLEQEWEGPAVYWISTARIEILTSEVCYTLFNAEMEDRISSCTYSSWVDLMHSTYLDIVKGVPGR
jgi:hypothetical protein